MAPAAARTLDRGWTFCPPDSKLTDGYLRDELAGRKPVPGFFHRVDIYSADPENLVKTLTPAPGTGEDGKPPVWYFVSPLVSAPAPGHKSAGTGKRKPRAVVGGTWHEESKKAVKGSAHGGYVKTFTYVKKPSSGTERLGWIMKEFHVPEQKGGGDRVVCKIYRTPRKKSKASSSTTTSASVSDPGDSKKRKAASNHPDAPTPGARRTYDENRSTEFLGQVFMEGSGETEHYDAEGNYYAAATQMELPPCVQDSFFLPSSEFYGTAHMEGGSLVFPPFIDDFDYLLEGSGGSDHMQGGDLEVPPVTDDFFVDLDDLLRPPPEDNV
jgi:hypothetical protein